MESLPKSIDGKREILDLKPDSLAIKSACRNNL